MKLTDRLPPVRVNRAYIRQRLMTAAEFALIREQFGPAVKALELLKTMIDEEAGEQTPERINVQIVDGRKARNGE
ncbi:hypothetical protein [Mailhella massiliensis]|uniref:hypothetical protein n=1 Tax=Mailhella massiliensis TaxID=1903261 RepID=UPI00097DDE94|nr:hypothetical protein [Mailhella massiliensis]